MKKHLLPQSKNRYKANLHCHTTISDGRKTPEEVKEIYKSLGYSIVAFTDHNIFIRHNELIDDTFLALNGLEIDLAEDKPLDWRELKLCHICFIALDPNTVFQPCFHRTKHLWGNPAKLRDKIVFDENEPDYERIYSGEGVSKLMQAAKSKGFFVTYNHPTWSNESYPEYINYFGMHAFEMFNGGCIVAGYDEFNHRVYDDFLQTGRRLYCIGADDNHNVHPLDSRHSDSGVAFTVILADTLDYRTVTTALVDGHFYTSMGPEIYELYYEDGYVHIKCSDADKIACSYGVVRAACEYAENGGTICEASFKVEPTDRYFRLTVTDKNGKTACTNAYFVEDLI